MSKELDEIARRCQAAGLDFTDGRHDDLAPYVIVHFPGTAGIPIYEGGQDRWVLEEVEQPFEEFEALLQGLHFVTWSLSQQMIESNLVELDPEMRMSAPLGPASQEQDAEYMAHLEKLKEELRRRSAGEEPNTEWDKPQSVGERRQGRIREILSRLAFAQNRSEYAEAPTDPGQRILIDSNTDLAISIGLSSNIHVLVQEESSWKSEDDRSLTLQIRGAKVKTQQEAADLLDKVADSVLFAIDEAVEIPLTLERGTRRTRTNYSRKESFPVASVDTEYDREAISLYWSAKTASSMPLIQFLAYYQVLEYYFQRYTKQETWKAMRKVLKHPRFDPRSDGDMGRLFRAANVNPRYRTLGRNELSRLTATIRECVSVVELREFIRGDRERSEYYESNRPKRISKETVSITDMSAESIGHREEAAQRIYDIRCRIVHAREGQEPLLPSDLEAEDLTHDIDLVEFLARKVLRASSRPLQV